MGHLSMATGVFDHSKAVGQQRLLDCLWFQSLAALELTRPPVSQTCRRRPPSARTGVARLCMSNGHCNARRTSPMMHDGPDIRIPGQRQPQPAHKPWCTNHMDGEGPRDFGTCAGETIVGGGIPVSICSHPTMGVRFDIGHDLDMEGTSVDDAERLLLALSIQIARARGITPPASALAAVGS